MLPPWNMQVNCFFCSSRRRHTRCLSDWSSDVCSSDLRAERVLLKPEAAFAQLARQVLTVQARGSGSGSVVSHCRLVVAPRGTGLTREQTSPFFQSKRDLRRRSQTVLPRSERLPAIAIRLYDSQSCTVPRA